MEWEELDFVTVLEVLPTKDNYGSSYDFTVEKESLQLSVVVYDYDCDIRVELRAQGHNAPVVELALNNVRRARRVVDRASECLLIEMDNDSLPTVSIWIKPHIRIYSSSL